MRRTKLPAALSSTLLLVAIAMGSAVTLMPASAHAQDEEALREARGKFQKAIELKHAKNWGGALKLFREVGQIKMTPQVRYHIATCEENLGQLVTALGGYELALAQAEDMAPEFIAEVQGSIDDLNGRIPKLVIERGEGGEAALIELDGVQIGENSIGDEMPVNPGPHTVTASAPGFDNYRETINVSEGSVEVLSVTLVPLEEGATPVTVTGPVDDGPKDFGPWPYVAGGVGIAGVGLGGAFLGLALGKFGKQKDLCGGDVQQCAASEADRDEVNKLGRQASTFEAAGWVGIGVGVLGLGAGVTMLVLSSGGEEADPSTARVALRPYAQGSDAGFSLVGSF